MLKFAVLMFGLLPWHGKPAVAEQLQPETPNPQRPALTREDTPLPVEVGKVHYSLKARIWKPAGAGPFPLVIINHGTPGDRSKLAGQTLQFSRAARWFVEQGFLVVVALRPGYGDSEGTFLEDGGPCPQEDYLQAGARVAAVEAAIVRASQRLPDADPSRVIVVGQSAGGLGAVALASHPPQGVRGIISFAGGRGSNGKGKICGGENRLIEAEAIWGRSNRLPQLWLYAQNDRFFWPELSHRMVEAFRAESRPKVTFVDLPPFSTDGHGSFNSGATGTWAPAVSTFLQQVLTAETPQ